MSNYPQIKGWKAYKSEGKIEPMNVTQIDKVPDGWKAPTFTQESNPHKRLFAESKFSVKFPKALEKYLREIWPAVQEFLKTHFVRAELDVSSGTMEVRTTPKTFDPFIIIKSDGLIRLLARFVPFDEARRVLDDDVSYDIIQIEHAKRETFLRRSRRLADPTVIQLMRDICECRVFVQGKTVAAIGDYDALKHVRHITHAYMHNNIHPIYNLKRIQIIRKLETMPEMAGKNWEKFLPPLPKKRAVKRRKPHKINVKRDYTPFPPPQQPSKIDEQLDKGTFHLAKATPPGAPSHAENSSSTAKLKLKRKRSSSSLKQDAMAGYENHQKRKRRNSKTEANAIETIPSDESEIEDD